MAPARLHKGDVRFLKIGQRLELVRVRLCALRGRCRDERYEQRDQSNRKHRAGRHGRCFGAARRNQAPAQQYANNEDDDVRRDAHRMKSSWQPKHIGGEPRKAQEREGPESGEAYPRHASRACLFEDEPSEMYLDDVTDAEGETLDAPEESRKLDGRDAEIFQHFREGVAQQVGEEDVETHFDLGIAYREMGMHQDAINEFAKAMGSPRRQVQAYTMIAVCYLEMGKITEAVDQYKQALHAEKITAEEELDVYYQMGQVYQTLGDNQEAIYYLEKVDKRQPGYRDVASQLERLHANAGN